MRHRQEERGEGFQLCAVRYHQHPHEEETEHVSSSVLLVGTLLLLLLLLLRPTYAQLHMPSSPFKIMCFISLLIIEKEKMREEKKGGIEFLFECMVSY